jgi:hypothetical protein
MAVEWEIKTNPDFEILYLRASSDERKIGVFLGKRKVKNQVEICQLIVFKRNQQNRWQLDAKVDHSFSSTTCAQFTFKKTDSNKLLMVTATAILELDYKAAEGLAGQNYQPVEIKQIETHLVGAPTYGIFSPDQKKCIMASDDYLLLIDLETGLELDIAAKESVQ